MKYKPAANATGATFRNHRRRVMRITPRPNLFQRDAIGVTGAAADIYCAPILPSMERQRTVPAKSAI